MRVQILASGSKGNATLVQSDQVSFLIDVGIPYATLKASLAKINVDPKDISAVLITHSHNDHIKGLGTFIQKTTANCLLPKGMYQELEELIPNSRVEEVDETFTLEDFTIKLIHTSHDTPCSVGYIIENQNHSLVYVTDTGYINQKYLKQMINKDIYIMESNHDEKMLMEGPYPYYLKQRVISDRGHLSNHTTASYLKEIIGDNTKYIVLAHLSENNNTEELALQTVVDEIKDQGNTNKQIIIARQREESPYIEV